MQLGVKQSIKTENAYFLTLTVIGWLQKVTSNQIKIKML